MGWKVHHASSTTGILLHVGSGKCPSSKACINCENIYLKVNKAQTGLYCILITSTSSVGNENIQDTKALWEYWFLSLTNAKKYVKKVDLM